MKVSETKDCGWIAICFCRLVGWGVKGIFSFDFRYSGPHNFCPSLCPIVKRVFYSYVRVSVCGEWEISAFYCSMKRKVGLDLDEAERTASINFANVDFGLFCFRKILIIIIIIIIIIIQVLSSP